MGPTEVMSEQLTMFGTSTCEMERTSTGRIYTLGEVLTRQELRAHILHEHQELDVPDVAARMGLTTDTVFGLLKRSRNKLTSLDRYSLVIDEPVWSAQDILESQLRAGIRCSNCNLLLPCRADGEYGPCDAHDPDQFEACMALLQFMLGNGRNSRDMNNPGKAVWAGKIPKARKEDSDD